jgi:hypothetical protein
MCPGIRRDRNHGHLNRCPFGGGAHALAAVASVAPLLDAVAYGQAAKGAVANVGKNSGCGVV